MRSLSNSGCSAVVLGSESAVTVPMGSRLHQAPTTSSASVFSMPGIPFFSDENWAVDCIGDMSTAGRRGSTAGRKLAETTMLWSYGKAPMPVDCYAGNLRMQSAKY